MIYGVVDGQRVKRATRTRPVVVAAAVGLTQFDSGVNGARCGYTFYRGFEDEDILAIYYLGIEEVRV